MHKTIKVGGKEIEVRGLTWGEKADLKREGINIGALDPNQDNDEVVEKVIRIACGDLDLDPLLSSEVYGLFREVIRLTFLTEHEAKN